MTQAFHTFSGVIVYGGPGSGNFGHAGRPGKVGGSAPKSGVGAAMSIEKGRTAAERQRQAAGKEPVLTEKKEWEEILGTDKTSLDKAKNQLRRFCPGFQDIIIEHGAREKKVVDGVNEFVRQFQDLSSKYSKFRGLLEDGARIPYLRFDLELGRGVAGRYNIEHGHITLPAGKGAARSLSQRKPRDKLKVKLGEHNACPDLGGTIRHEIGHAVRRSLGTSQLEGFRMAVIKDSGAPPDNYWIGGGKAWAAKAISRYSSTNSSEAFSEAFSAYTSPAYKNSKKKLPKSTEDYFRDLLGD